MRRKSGRHGKEFGLPGLVLIGLGSLAGLMLVSYFARPAVRVTVIPPDEPINLHLEGVWTDGTQH